MDLDSIGIQIEKLIFWRRKNKIRGGRNITTHPTHPTPLDTALIFTIINYNDSIIIMIIIMDPTKKSTINLVLILIKLMRKREKEKIDIRGGMI